jgi:hypothetical protein
MYRQVGNTKRPRGLSLQRRAAWLGVRVFPVRGRGLRWRAGQTRRIRRIPRLGCPGTGPAGVGTGSVRWVRVQRIRDAGVEDARTVALALQPHATLRGDPRGISSPRRDLQVAHPLLLPDLVGPGGEMGRHGGGGEERGHDRVRYRGDRGLFKPIPGPGWWSFVTPCPGQVCAGAGLPQGCPDLTGGQPVRSAALLSRRLRPRGGPEDPGLVQPGAAVSPMAPPTALAR